MQCSVFPSLRVWILREVSDVAKHRYLLVLERKTRGRQLHLAETFCQVKLSTTCFMLKNQQIPIYRRGN